MSGAWRNHPFEDRQEQTKRLRALAMAPGAGIGSMMLHVLLTREESEGQLDWREAALNFAEIVNRFHKQSLDIARRTTSPTIIVNAETRAAVEEWLAARRGA